MKPDESAGGFEGFPAVCLKTDEDKATWKGPKIGSSGKLLLE